MVCQVVLKKIVYSTLNVPSSEQKLEQVKPDVGIVFSKVKKYGETQSHRKRECKEIEQV